MTPFVFFALSLPVALRQEGVPLELIGLTALVYGPAAFSFLWAGPVEARIRRARRAHLGWIAVPLGLMACASVVLSLVPPSGSFGLLFGLIMVIVLLSATGRIALMGYSVAAFRGPDHAVASVTMLLGSAVASLLGAGGLLYVYSLWGWAPAILGMGASAALGAACAALARGCAPTHGAAVGDAPARPALRQFLRRPGAGSLMGLLAVLGVGVGLGFGMVQPLLVAQGYSNAEIALVNATITFGALLLGGPISTLCIRRAGLRVTLVLGLVLSIAVFALACALTLFWPGIASGAVIVGLVFLTFSFLSVANTTFFMKLSNQGQESTDLTLIQSLYLVWSLLGAALSGVLAGQYGFWAPFAGAAGVTLLALWALRAVLRGPQGQSAVPSGVGA